MNKTFKLAMLGSALALASGAVSAETYNLCAVAGTKALPDGSNVPVWGYALDTGGGCPTVPDVPGPALVVTDGTLTINLTNNLPEPSSIVIPGLPMPASGGIGPNWDFGPAGPRTDPAQRVRSYGAEAAAGGGTETYGWTGVRPGTFLYHSGTHPQKQVYMGLYGAVTQNAVEADTVNGTPAEAYAGVPYDNEVVLLYSEIDPDLNASINELYNPTGLVTPYTTSIDYHARWFLVNGEPYSLDCNDDGTGLDVTSGYPCASMALVPDISEGTGANPLLAKERTLLRFLSASSETHVPTLQGIYMTIHAEDGFPYAWEDTSTGDTGTSPREQYSIMLPALKTKDAIIEPQLDGRYAIYDGNGYMTNPTDPEDTVHKDVVGGMLRFLAIGADGNLPPIGTPDSATVVESGSITIDVLANDSDPEGQPLSIVGVNTTGTTGTVTCNGTCSYTAAAGAGTDTFTYDVSDGVNTTAGVLVTVTVEANVAPIANPDTDTTDSATPVTLNVLANDVGQPGETLAIATFDATSANGATVSCDTVTGDCTYTPDGVFTGADTFTYTATDGTLNSTPATVTITVDPVAGNTPPVAVDDPYNVIEDGILSIAAPGVLGNDTDADGDPLTATLVSGPTNAAAFSFQTTGAFFYQPNPNFTGTDTFTYLANDGTADSNVATVTITVDPGNDIPVANDDTFFLKSMYDTG
ncbi:MAG: Ig-like domain-containing protein, partial [Chromatiales bacterium]